MRVSELVRSTIAGSRTRYGVIGIASDVIGTKQFEDTRDNVLRPAPAPAPALLWERASGGGSIGPRPIDGAIGFAAT